MSNIMYSMVKDFHNHVKQPIQDPKKPIIPARAELRAKLIEEEAAETAQAIREGDLVETIDGLCDLLYVIYGCAVEAGLDLDPYFIEVHMSNMTKKPGNERGDGKILKDGDFKPPRIAELLYNHKRFGIPVYDNQLDIVR